MSFLPLAPPLLQPPSFESFRSFFSKCCNIANQTSLLFAVARLQKSPLFFLSHISAIRYHQKFVDEVSKREIKVQPSFVRPLNLLHAPARLHLSLIYRMQCSRLHVPPRY